MRLARPLSKGGMQNKELERQPWGQGLATLSEDLSSVSSTPHPPWLQLCPLLVSMGTALICMITHIHRSMHINEKMIKTNYYYSTFYWVIVSPHKITVQGATNTLSCIQCWLDTRHTMAGQSGQAAGGLLRGSRILSLVFSHTLQSQAAAQLHSIDWLPCIISGRRYHTKCFMKYPTGHQK